MSLGDAESYFLLITKQKKNYILKLKIIGRFSCIGVKN